MTLDLRLSSRFARHIGWTLAARLLLVANSVGVGVIVARWLGAEGLGQYAVLTVTVNNLVQIGGAGLTAANVFFVARERELLPTVSINALWFALCGGLGLAGGIVAAAWLRPAWFHNIPLGLLMLAAAALPFLLLTLLQLNLFLAVGEVARYNALDALGQSFGLLNAVTALILCGAGVWALVGLNTAASLLVSALITYLIYRWAQGHALAENWRPDARQFVRMMRYGIKINVMNAALVLLLRADVLLVNYFRGGAEAGVYAVAGQMSLMLLMLPNVVGTLLFPRVAETRDERGEFTARAVRHTVLLLAVLCLAAIPAAFLAPLVYGPAFADAPRQFLLLLPGAALLGLQMILSQHLVGVGVTWALPLAWSVTVILSVTLNLTFTPYYGAHGAAAISSVCYALIFAFTLFLFRRQTGQNLADTLIIRRHELARFGRGQVAT